MKDYIICKPVMLPTQDNTSPIHVENYKDTLFLNKNGVTGTHHLYLVSDEEIKEGDWYLRNDTNEVKECRNYFTKDQTPPYCKRIVASTDKSLGLALIPQSFIKEYVQKQGKIDQVKIQLYHRGGKELVSAPYNEVIIFPIKDSFTIEDMRKAFGAYYMIGFPHQVNFDEWFDKNY